MHLIFLFSGFLCKAKNYEFILLIQSLSWSIYHPYFHFSHVSFLKFLPLMLQRHVPLYSFSNFLFFLTWLWLFSWLLIRIYYLEERCHTISVASRIVYTVLSRQLDWKPIVRSTYLFQRCWKNHSSVQMDQKDRAWKVTNNLGLFRERWTSSLIRTERAGYMSHVPRLCEECLSSIYSV